MPAYIFKMRENKGFLQGEENAGGWGREGLEMSPTGRRSHLEGYRINSQSSDNLELAAKGLWRTAACFRGQ